MAVCLAASLANPVNTDPLSCPVPLGVQTHGDLIAVAAKRKKKQSKQVYRNPRNGDVLLGRVETSEPRKGQGGNDAALGALFGGGPRGGQQLRRSALDGYTDFSKMLKLPIYGA